MAPDPPVYPVDESVPHNYDAALVIGNNEDSDSEAEEHTAYDGYTLLGQHDQLAAGPVVNNEIVENENDEVYDNASIDRLEDPGEPSLPTAGRAELVALWNSAPVEAPSTRIAMDDERSDQIRAAMAGFSLPPSAVPAWASEIPEEMWKEKILDRLQQTKSCSN